MNDITDIVTFVRTWARIDGSDYAEVLPALTTTALVQASHETGHDYLTETVPQPVMCWVAAQVAYWIRNPEAGMEKQMMPSPFHGGLLDPYRKYAWTLDA